MGRICSVTYDCGKQFLSKGSVFDLQELHDLLNSSGIKSTLSRGNLSVSLDSSCFYVYANGKIGLAYLQNESQVVGFESITLNFFWQNFASKCVKKKEEFYGKKI